MKLYHTGLKNISSQNQLAPRDLSKVYIYFSSNQNKPKLIRANQRNYKFKLRGVSFEQYLNKHLKGISNYNVTNLSIPNNQLTNLFKGPKLQITTRVNSMHSPFFERFALQSRYDLPFIFSNIGFLFLSQPHTL